MGVSGGFSKNPPEDVEVLAAFWGVRILYCGTFCGYPTPERTAVGTFQTRRSGAFGGSGCGQKRSRVSDLGLSPANASRVPYLGLASELVSAKSTCVLDLIEYREQTMDTVLIDLYRNRNSERWLIVRSDGRITMHTESRVFGVLAGYREVTDAPIALDEVRARNPAVAAAVEGALDAMRARDEAVGRVVAAATTRPDEAVEGSVSAVTKVRVGG